MRAARQDQLAFLEEVIGHADGQLDLLDDLDPTVEELSELDELLSQVYGLNSGKSRRSRR